MEGEFTWIYIEEDLPWKIRKKIEKELSLKGPEGMDIRLYNISYIVEDLVEKFRRNLREEEVLIISEDRSLCLKLIDEISSEFRFISVLGLDEQEGENLYEEVLESTGISVYLPQGKNISLNRYGLVINVLNKTIIDVDKINNRTIILDFGGRKLFEKANRYVIGDISLEIKGLGLAENPWISEEINSSLYECLFHGECRKYKRIYKGESLLTMDEFINQNPIIKGGY